MLTFNAILCETLRTSLVKDLMPLSEELNKALGASNTPYLFDLLDPDFHAGLDLFGRLRAVGCCHVVWRSFQHTKVECVAFFKGHLEESTDTEQHSNHCFCLLFVFCSAVLKWYCVFMTFDLLMLKSFGQSRLFMEIGCGVTSLTVRKIKVFHLLFRPFYSLQSQLLISVG